MKIVSIFTHGNEIALITDEYPVLPLAAASKTETGQARELQTRPDNPRLAYRDTEVFTKWKYTPCTGYRYVPVSRNTRYIRRSSARKYYPATCCIRSLKAYVITVIT